MVHMKLHSTVVMYFGSYDIGYAIPPYTHVRAHTHLYSDPMPMWAIFLAPSLTIIDVRNMMIMVLQNTQVA